MMDVYLIAGQSNALGISPVSGMSEQYSFSSLLYQASNVSVPQERRIVPVCPGLGADESKFGLELGAAKAFSDGRVGFIKYASDGTSLYDRWSAAGEDFLGLKQTFSEGMRAFEELGHAPRVRGMLWMQGENDASFEYQAEAYEENFRAFVARVREFAGEIPIAVGQTNPSNPCLPFSDAVNRAKKRVAEDTRGVLFVRTDDLTHLIDNYHYTAADMMALGERLAAAIKENLV